MKNTHSSRRDLRFLFLSLRVGDALSDLRQRKPENHQVTVGCVPSTFPQTPYKILRLWFRKYWHFLEPLDTTNLSHWLKSSNKFQNQICSTRRTEHSLRVLKNRIPGDIDLFQQQEILCLTFLQLRASYAFCWHVKITQMYLFCKWHSAWESKQRFIETIADDSGQSHFTFFC